MKEMHTDSAKRQSDKTIMFQTLFLIRTELERLESQRPDFGRDISAIIYRVDKLIEALISDYEKSLFE